LKIDIQLCIVIKSTIHSSLKKNRTYETCSKVWEQAKLLYANNTHRLYGVCQNLLTIVAPKRLDGTMSEYLGKWTSVLRRSKNSLIELSPFLHSTQFNSQVCAFALVCELKCEWALSQSWKECLHLMTLAKNDVEKNDCNHESMSWPSVSQVLYSGFSIPRSQWKVKDIVKELKDWRQNDEGDVPW